MKKLYFLFILLLGSVAVSAQSSIVINFENKSIDDPITWTGWVVPADASSTVAADPLDASNKVLRFAPNNYNALPYLEFTLAAGKTLADYQKFTFKGYFAQGDVGWKDILVAAFSAPPTSGFQDSNPNLIGKWARSAGGSTAWEDITVEFTQNLSILSQRSGTIYILFGMSTAGTGDIGGSGLPTVWYADNVTLVGPGGTTSLPSNRISSDIYVTNSYIVINNAEGKKLEVYSMTGAKMFEKASAGSKVDVNVPKGIYIVVVDGVSTKVAVK